MKPGISRCASWVFALALWAATGIVPAQAVDRDAWKQPETRARLKSGMTLRQVEEVLGKPSRTRTTRSDAGTTRDLEYRSSDGMDWMIAFFMGGERLTTYNIARLGEPESSLDSVQAWRSPDAWLKVMPGMSLDEVEAILGKPTSKSYATTFSGQEAVTGWLYDLEPETDGTAGIIMVGNERAISIWTPLFPTH